MLKILNARHRRTNGRVLVGGPCLLQLQLMLHRRRQRDGGGIPECTGESSVLVKRHWNIGVVVGAGDGILVGWRSPAREINGRRSAANGGSDGGTSDGETARRGSGRTVSSTGAADDDATRRCWGRARCSAYRTAFHQLPNRKSRQKKKAKEIRLLACLVAEKIAKETKQREKIKKCRYVGAVGGAVRFDDPASFHGELTEDLVDVGAWR